MAEGLLKKVLKKAEDDDEVPKREYKTESRGVFAVDGDSASENSIVVLDENYGVDIGGHRARQLVEEDIYNSYLILTMTEEHKHVILMNWPDAEDKTFTLKEYAEMSAQTDEDSTELFGIPRYDIQDPYRGDIKDYEECAAEIYEAILKVKDKLMEK
jgi:protein-tyrosine phosphatase